METYFTVEEMICGYHVYKDVRNSNIGEMLPCTIKRSYRYDPNAIAVMKGGTVVGHLPRKISFISKLFLELEGSAIECEVISGKKVFAGFTTRWTRNPFFTPFPGLHF